MGRVPSGSKARYQAFAKKALRFRQPSGRLQSRLGRIGGENGLAGLASSIDLAGLPDAANDYAFTCM